MQLGQQGAGGASRPSPIDWHAVISIDLRSLALARIALGLAVVVCFLQQLPLVEELFSDRGVLPRDWARAVCGLGSRPSLFYLSGGTALPTALLLVGALAGLGFLLGWRPRLCALMIWLLLGELNLRVPLLQADEQYLRFQIVWYCFLPSAARFSVSRPPPGTPPAVAGVHAAALIVQMTSIFFFAACEKTGPTWWEGTATHYALHVEAHTEPWAALFHGQLWLTRLVTWLTLLTEFAAPLLLLSPWRTWALRGLGLVLIGGGLVAVNALLRVSHVAAAILAGTLVFIPPAWWERAEGLLSRLPRLPRVTQSPAWPFRPPLPLRVAVAALMLLVLAANLSQLPATYHVDVPTPIRRLARLLYLEQHYELFAPEPPALSGWFAHIGTLASGVRLDLRQERLAPYRPDQLPPQGVREVESHFQWMRIQDRISLPHARPWRKPVADYLCRRWNDRHPATLRLQEIEIRWSYRRTLLTGGYAPKIQHRTVYRGPCPGSAPQIARRR